MANSTLTASRSKRKTKRTVGNGDGGEIDTGDGISRAIPIEMLIRYSERNLTYQEIADLVGCSKSNVYQRFKYIGYTPERLKTFKSLRADVFAETQRQMMQQLTPDKLEKMSAYQHVGMIGILHGLERVERGEATQIIGYQDMSKSKQSVDSEIQIIEAEITKLEEQVTNDAMKRTKDNREAFEEGGEVSSRTSNTCKKDIKIQPQHVFLLPEQCPA